MARKTSPPGGKQGTGTDDAPARLKEYRRKRDFRLTKEPAGQPSSRAPGRGKKSLRFVIQKHSASHLHFDLRLEMDGVMKSWAVPKGPSTDPKMKRLAMQVEDHPVEYNTFEGTIPKGQYGGGTVMLWDKGTYTADPPTGDDETVLREKYRKGDLKVRFDGERMQGSYALVRMGGRSFGSPDKPQWLMIKHRDEAASEDDIVAENMTSVTTGRTMEEIAGDRKSKTWQSSRDEPGKAGKSVTKSRPTVAGAEKPVKLPSVLEPMFASVGTGIPAGNWTFEPKYDGIRVLAFCTARDARLITRNGHDKSRQFPEIADALRKLASSARRDFVLDGEIVAMKGKTPARFQELQGRMHVTDDKAIALHRTGSPSGIFLFDILVDGKDVLVRERWTARRERLEKRLAGRTSDIVHIAETVPKGEKLLDRARAKGWEGVIAKRTDSIYEPGNRSRSWLKLKIEFRQEFVVGGYTDPRNSRVHLGAILLGYYDGDDFVYAGHTGGGFSQQTLGEMYKLLEPLERDGSPFSTKIKTNERPTWVEPRIVVEVKFTEWTADGRLRHPIYLGTRTDKKARAVTREAMSVQPGTPGAAQTSAKTIEMADMKKNLKPAATKVATSRKAVAKGIAAAKPPVPLKGEAARVLEQIDELCGTEKRGTLDFGRGRTLSVTNLAKVFFPATGHTKGDLLRYYTLVSPFLLPTIVDRPLVLKRFPNGVEGEAFYQQKASDDTPKDVRVEIVTNDVGDKQRRFIGGDLLTLLHTIQLGAVSVDPWHSRIPDSDFADYSIIDLDPGDKATFKTVVQVAKWVKEVLDELDLHAALKTSGSTGLHVYMPLPSQTPNEAATLVAQVVASRVAERHPKEATITRMVKARGPSTVYVDYLQNIKGKTVAGAYCVRAREGATVSTPLGWSELNDKLDPRDFTIDTALARFAKKGDIWGAAMKKRNTLKKLLSAGSQKSLKK